MDSATLDLVPDSLLTGFTCDPRSALQEKIYGNFNVISCPASIFTLVTLQVF
jgi:hypothetical protein